MKNNNTKTPSSAKAQVKVTKTSERAIKHAGLLTIQEANVWINDSLKTPDPRMFFNDLIVENENTVIFAASNVGKSILAVQIAEDIAKVEKVLYVDMELSSKQFQMRYTDEHSGKAHIFPRNFTRAEIDPELMMEANLEEELFDSIESAAKKGVKFFLIDNLTCLCNGAESGSKAADFMKKLIRLKKIYGLTTVVIAHTPKRKGWKPITQNDLAGSAKLINFFDAGIALARSAKDNNLRYLKQVKVRTGEFLYDSDNVLLLDANKDDGYLKFDVIGCGNEDEHLEKLTGGEAADEIMEILMMHRDGKSVRQIAEEMNLSKSAVDRRLQAAKKDNITLPNDPVPTVPGHENVGHLESAGYAA